MTTITGLIRLGCISDPNDQDKRHRTFIACRVEEWAALTSLYEREPDMHLDLIDFPDNPEIAEAATEWVSELGEKGFAFLGSAEYGQWASWNLVGIARPAIPAP
ncbi:hypothetical protein ABTX71_01690 [Streptomyces parvulus]|uniref:hypothetical protein n=1 Tax=Streptomyces parvulus TaxID=146923 RepID=UPI00332D5488